MPYTQSRHPSNPSKQQKTRASCPERTSTRKAQSHENRARWADLARTLLGKKTCGTLYKKVYDDQQRSGTRLQETSSLQQKGSKISATEVELPTSIQDKHLIQSASKDPNAVAGSKVDLVNQMAMSAAETSSKIYKRQSYGKAVNEPTYGRRWREAIENEVDNLADHNSWEYEELLVGRHTGNIRKGDTAQHQFAQLMISPRKTL